MFDICMYCLLYCGLHFRIFSKYIILVYKSCSVGVESLNRFIELNETKIKYNVKTDKNSAPVQRTHRTLHGL